MAITVTVKHRDGTRTDTTVWASTEVAFEDHFGKSWSEAFSDPHPNQKYLYFVAWHSIYDAGKTALEFTDYLRTIDTVELGAVDSPPLAPDRQAG